MNKNPEKMVQDAIFRWMVMHRNLAIRINSGAMTFDSPSTGSGQAKRRFVRFATWQVVGEALSWAGVSDILACCGGKFVAIEVKAPGKRKNTTEAQEKFLAAVRRCGGLAIVAEGIEDVEAALR